MKKSQENIINNILLLILVVFIIIVSMQLYGTAKILNTLKPQLQEEFISVQTVELNGEKYVCGDVVENRDNESLYCRGYKDGYSWCLAQLNFN